MKNSVIHLEGPITGLTYSECASWQEYVKIKLGFEKISATSALDDKDNLLREPLENEDYKDEKVLETGGKINDREKQDIEKADIVLVNLLGAQKVSIGAVMGITRASEKNKPIVIAMEEGNPHRHVMLMDTAVSIVPTLDTAIERVIEILKPKKSY